ncbi:phosphatidylserine decarboxylase [Sphingomonas bacterium]|uniref:phosphatidylserine decarboxylase n=1 Tax=Sphingomonas bacterium TaxID=1895847 RepID=UPI001577563A|nr:phosphatidylserine decarboxylase [Sphingomonas bacterium]
MSSLETRPDTTPSAQWRWPSVHPEGRKFALISAGITALMFLVVSHVLGWLMIGVTIWVAAFFRDPVRAVPQGKGLIVAPADGLITMIQQVAPPRELVGEDALGTEPLIRVSIFMSVFDVHINRAPIAGTISRVVYISGKFVNASLDKASEENERQHLLVEGTDGTRVGFTQIAGLVARRILPFVKPGDIVAAGQRIGLIRFGSRVDVYLPAGAAPRVALGQRSIAGETILARLGDGEAARGLPL